MPCALIFNTQEMVPIAEVVAAIWALNGLFSNFSLPGPNADALVPARYPAPIGTVNRMVNDGIEPLAAVGIETLAPLAAIGDFVERDKMIVEFG